MKMEFDSVVWKAVPMVVVMADLKAPLMAVVLVVMRVAGMADL